MLANNYLNRLEKSIQALIENSRPRVGDDAYGDDTNYEASIDETLYWLEQLRAIID